MRSPREMKALYERGENISHARRLELGLEQNSNEVIELSYDLQTGAYIDAVTTGGLAAHKAEYSAEIAAEILRHVRPASLLEVGVGEATTLLGVAQNLPDETSIFGFDLSWSRAAFAKNWLQENGVSDAWIGTGDLFAIPFAANSIDVVYTSHSIEPNGGREAEILRELLRVTRRTLILLEPAFELATEEQRERMASHGYCRDLPATAQALGEEMGCHVLSHELFPYSANPDNPTGITVIEKFPAPESDADAKPALACPKYKTPLQEINGLFFSEEALVVYPTIGGIPCLRIENGILASKFKDVARAPSTSARPRPA